MARLKGQSENQQGFKFDLRSCGEFLTDAVAFLPSGVAPNAQLGPEECGAINHLYGRAEMRLHLQLHFQVF